LLVLLCNSSLQFCLDLAESSNIGLVVGSVVGALVAIGVAAFMISQRSNSRSARSQGGRRTPTTPITTNKNRGARGAVPQHMKVAENQSSLAEARESLAELARKFWGMGSRKQRHRKPSRAREGVDLKELVVSKRDSIFQIGSMRRQSIFSTFSATGKPSHRVRQAGLFGSSFSPLTRACRLQRS
jgi:hypothetical protein